MSAAVRGQIQTHNGDTCREGYTQELTRQTERGRRRKTGRRTKVAKLGERLCSKFSS